MFKRRIGFFYINDPNWIGGMDYVINAVNALSYLNESDQPRVDILIAKDVDTTILGGRLHYKKYNFYFLPDFNKSSFFQWLINKYRWKFIYPFPKGKIYDKLFQGIKESRKIFWIPDFQEEYFPYLFDEVSLKKRRKMRTFFAKQNKNIVVFSSENALMDFRNFYGPEINAKTKVLQFANPDHWKFESLFIEQTLQKYNLVSNGYFICPNQIWEHKNHQIVLDAVRMCSQKNSKLKVVFCGKEYDPRNPNYVTDLKLKGKDLVDSGHIQFLGFLPKDEQMCLIKESIALIQPSKFEGWSTTIEDGIVFGKQIIASNLLVNQEQLKDNGIYFDPVNTDELSKILLNYCNTNSYVDYNQRKRVEEFAFKLVGLLD